MISIEQVGQFLAPSFSPLVATAKISYRLAAKLYELKTRRYERARTNQAWLIWATAIAFCQIERF